MSISAVSSVSQTPYTQSAHAVVAAKAHAATAAKGTDSDGDNDGSTAAPGRLDVKL
jgi:hypothetical protein